MRLLLTLLLLTGLSANAQPLWRNFFTTNQNPRVTVVAGSNATVQASTVGTDQRIFTVNSVPGAGTGQTNNTIVIAGTNGVVVVTNSGGGITTYTVHNTNIAGISQTNWPLSSITNANYLTNWALIPTNFVPAESTHATNADFVLASTLTNKLYASNIVSGGQVPIAALSPNAGADGWILIQSNNASVWSRNGAFLTNVGDAYLANNQAFTGSNYIATLTAGANTKIAGVGASASTDPALVVLRAVDDSGGGNAHGFADSSTITRSGGIGYASFDAHPRFEGVNDYDHWTAFQCSGTYASSGKMDRYYGFYSAPIVSAGIVADLFSLYIADGGGAGAVTNQYGLFVSTLSRGTNNWSIYTSTTPSLFGGDVHHANSLGSVGTGAKVYFTSGSSRVNEALLQHQIVSSSRGDLRLRVRTSSASGDAGLGDVLTLFGGSSYGVGVNNTNPTAKLDVTGDIRASTTITPTNGIVNQGKHSFTTNFTVVQSTQIYNCNGTNQVITLPNCTNSTAWQIYRFSCTNGYAKLILTNANGLQTIRDGTSLSFTQIGVGEVGFYHDGAHWWVASKAKTIFPVAQFSTSTNIPLTAANTAYPVTFNSTDFNNSQGIALGVGTNGFHSKMWITNSGQYEFDPSVVQSFNGNDTIRFWFRKFDTNIANSATPSKGQNGSIRVITVPFIVNVTEPTPFEIWAESDTTGEELLAGSASGNYPAAPSVICPVKRVSDTWP